MKPQASRDALRRPSQVAQRVRDSRDRLPGERDALPPGTLPGHKSGPQGDENREPAMPPTPPRGTVSR